MEQVSDIVLFQRIRQDDRLALNTLFANYYQQLCRFACSCSLSPEEAEEAVADVFFTLWKNRERLDVHSNLRAYLYKCVRNAALATLRAVNPEVAYTTEHDLADDVTPQLKLEYDELQHELNRIVDKLPTRCRQIFVMNRFDGLKYKEISVALGLSEKTVEHQMVKALEIVRTAITTHRSQTSLHKSVTVS